VYPSFVAIDSYIDGGMGTGKKGTLAGLVLSSGTQSQVLDSKSEVCALHKTAANVT